MLRNLGAVLIPVLTLRGASIGPTSTLVESGQGTCLATTSGCAPCSLGPVHGGVVVLLLGLLATTSSQVCTLFVDLPLVVSAFPFHKFFGFGFPILVN